MSTSTPQSRRVVFWVCFLAVAGVGLALALSGQHRRSKAHRTVEMLRSMLASDARFQKVTASYGTNGSAWLNGTVSSEEDLRALRTLVEQGDLPMQPGISVQVDAHPANIPAAGKARIALLFAFVHHGLGLPEPGRHAKLTTSH